MALQFSLHIETDRNYLEKLDQIKMDDKESYCLESILDYLKSMRILHQDAIKDESYVKDENYSSVHYMKNMGGLMLISKEYFPFKTALMKK